MAATKLVSTKRVYADGTIVEAVVWLLSEPVPPCTHRYKYRLFYGRHRERIIGFDNERGKGDHKHWLGVETPYEFTTLGQLLTDFEALLTMERAPYDC
jgi:hypothetical protein